MLALDLFLTHLLALLNSSYQDMTVGVAVTEVVAATTVVTMIVEEVIRVFSRDNATICGLTLDMQE